MKKMKLSKQAEIVGLVRRTLAGVGSSLSRFEVYLIESRSQLRRLSSLTFEASTCCQQQYRHVLPPCLANRVFPVFHMITDIACDRNR